ncbi:MULTISPECIES: PASTA domain-containing protein [Bacteroidota]|jgi:beta-lactam-binding protein with PASTA domain|uniref:PASTA domain-containing protein n=3 Tax=Flectobacillus TaxID=101 RepID=A0ABT6Z5G1_9BACT|nr:MULTISPECIES: PASTA domain-containing protein [Bacteroidota]NBA78482.1 PASTA domain-containing protein [Emticicia sp. ODNR4P]MDI9862468.1 PASTA domain-containing protein [Flectobacillus roseus]MDI9865127.1 PASTA domain-containing protein [Flectobacillus longus]MDI9872270.1 PASTA domain-containing protein [Flectobacillus roseus]MDI9876235.1 PASTA domain-containing protein [Flectobacillus rivi]
MIKIPTNSKKDVYTHAAIIVCLLMVLFFGFFFIYLPWSTNHGETITVPSLKGLTMEEAEDLLDERNLDYEVTDSTFTPGKKPLTVLSQYPLENSKVKQGRKIYLTINTETAPMIKLPKLTEMSVRSAEQQLLIAGLLKPSLEYQNDIRENEVLEVKYQGTKIDAGTLIAKGSKVTLIVGNGTGNVELEIPCLIGKPLDEAIIIISGSGLQKGTVIYDPDSTEPAGTVIRQNPACEDGKIKAGEMIDLWVAGNPPSGE